MASTPPPVLRIHLLGGFRVFAGSRPVDDRAWRLKKARRLVQYLALAPGHARHREQLMDLLWPDLDPKAAAANLHQVVHAARRALSLEPAPPPAPGSSRSSVPASPPLPVPGSSSSSARASRPVVDRNARRRTPIQVRHQVIRLDPNEPVWIDVEAFEREASRARIARVPGAYEAALSLYTGDLLPEDPYDDLIAQRRRYLRDTYLALLFELAGLHEAAGDWPGALAAYRRGVAADTLDERSLAGLLRACAMLGEVQEARRRYHDYAEHLRRELGIRPTPELQHLYESVVKQAASSRRRHRAGTREGSAAVVADLGADHALGTADPAPASGETGADHGAAAPPPQLPLPRTSFVGRRQEIGTVLRLLRTHRLLTLTGAGGCGKTRLALAAATAAATDVAAGWRFVDLGSLAPGSDAVVLAHRLAAGAGIDVDRRAEIGAALIDHLAPRRLLLVLDNCEHVLEACRHLVHRLLDTCPHLRVLATSREALSIDGELSWEVPALSLPAPGPDGTPEADLARVAAADAVQLFVARARMVVPGFELTAENARQVETVCRALDGLPLAIEVAASRLRSRSLADLAGDLEQGLHLLQARSGAGEARHRSLQAALDWSYGLLAPAEQVLLRRLAVFTGGWTLEGAAAVADRGGRSHRQRVADTLDDLVRKSLVRARRSSLHTRYDFLQPVRQYLWERLVAADDTDTVRQRHAEYFLALAEGLAPHLRGARQVATVARLREEQDNLRAALTWFCETGNLESGLRLAIALGRFWDNWGAAREAHAWLERLLALPRPSHPPPDLDDLLARAAWWRGRMAYHLGDYPAARTTFVRHLRRARRLGEPAEAGFALLQLGHVHQRRARFRAARRCYRQAIATYRRLDLTWYLGMALLSLSQVSLPLGDTDTAFSALQESAAIFGSIGDVLEQSRCLLQLARLELAMGRPDHARAGGERLLALCRRSGGLRILAHALVTLGQAAAAAGAWEEARGYLREALVYLQQFESRHGLRDALEVCAAMAAQADRHDAALRLAAAACRFGRFPGPLAAPPPPINMDTLVTLARQALGARPDTPHPAELHGALLTPMQAVQLARAVLEP
ncbi:MAG TPA: tetratricopeptide repeat protein [Bacillota bacterium]